MALQGLPIALLGLIAIILAALLIGYRYTRNRPVRRLLTSGMVIGGVDSLFAGAKPLATPHLDVAYTAPRESTYWMD